jgi:mRNA-degrading endonuclease RelE of RelBE toxin-antitoxin system
MSYKIKATPNFEREFKRLVKKYRSLKSEFSEMLSLLQDNPNLGVPLGNNTFKIRLAVKSKGKGKSGGMRVITYTATADLIVLLSIYNKGEQSSIQDTEIMELIKKWKLNK